MMDRNREARRAAAMANGLHRRRHRTTTNPSTLLRHSPEEERAMESAETARLRDRVVKKERGDREIRELERLNRSKRRRGDKFSVREDGGFGDSSEDSVNEDGDENDDDDAASGHVRYIPSSPSNPVPSPVSASPASGTVLSHRKSYPPPSKVSRVAPTWKAPDEMIGVSIPRKARSASTKRSHECWSSGGVVGGGEQHASQASPSPVAVPEMTPIPSPSPSPSHGTHPLSPSSSNISLKKKFKANGGKQRPPKSWRSKPDEIEMEVAEVLFGLKKQSEAATNESKSGVSSPIPNPPPPPLTVLAPKRKRPRQSPDHLSKPDPEQNQKEVSEQTPVRNNGNMSEKVAEESIGGRNGMAMRSTTKVEEASTSSPSLESSLIHDRPQLPSTSIKPNSTPLESANRREDKLEIDLMTPASPGEEMGDDGGGRDEKCTVTDKEMQPKSKAKDVVDDDKAVEGGGVAGIVVTKSEKNGTLSSPPPPLHQRIIDTEKSGVIISKLNFQQHPPKIEAHSDKTVGQTSSVPLPLSVPGGWHGGLPPMGYVRPLQGVVSMDGTPMPSPPIQPPPPPHFVFSQEKRPKRCATHCYIAKSVFVHQQLMKMNTHWPSAAAACPASLFDGKEYSPSMVPSTGIHAGRNMVSPAQDTKGQPFAVFPGQLLPSTSLKDKTLQAVTIPDPAQKKQYLVPPSLPPGTPSNIMHGPALFFPMGQQQAVGSARPNTGKSPLTVSGAASKSLVSSAQMGAAISNAPSAGPAMSFSYPNMNGNETQFMAILGNGAYPFPIPAHVGAVPQYRGSHPQAMSYFNGSFYPTQMLHPSQVQAQSGPTPLQSMQMQQQNHQITNTPTATSTSQKHLQNQQRRHQGGGASNVGNPNQNTILQNFQGTKGLDISGEDSPSSADSRNRPNMSLYNQSFPLPFHSPNYALIPSSLGGGGATSGPGVPNGNNHGDKNQQQQQSQQAAALNASPFPMSFTTINDANTPGLDISSMAQHHAIFQSLPEAAKQSYQMMAAAAAAQAAQQQRMNSYRGPDDGKSGAGAATELSTNPSTSVGQSIAFSRDLAENSVIDSSARSLNLHRSARPARSSAPNNVTSSSNSQQQQQQHSQMLFPKQQKYTPSTAGNSRSKNPLTSNGNVFPDNLTSSPVMAAKFPSSLSGFPSLVLAGGGGSAPQSQWKNSVRPNTSQMSSPSVTTNSTPSNLKSIPQQQGRAQQSHTQISFGSSKPNPSPQVPQTQNTNQRPSSPMMAGSPSNSSMSKSAGGSPRTSASNKSVGQTSILSSQQGKNSPSPSLSNQKPSILGGLHIMSTPDPAGKSQLQQQQQQPQLSKQSIQQAELYFNSYMQHAANTSGAMSGTGYYLQRHRPDNQQQQESQNPKPQGGSAPPTSSRGMLSLSAPASFTNVSTSDPAKAVASNMKGGLHSQGVFNAASQSGGATRQLIPTSSPYAHAVSAGAPVKPREQKQPAGE